MDIFLSNTSILITILGTLIFAYSRHLLHDVITNGEMFMEHNNYLRQKNLYYCALGCFLLAILSATVLCLYLATLYSETMGIITVIMNMFTLVLYIFISVIAAGRRFERCL